MPVEPSFYWHDYETFGRTPRRDRPAQFAGLRTNLALEEIGPPLLQYCRPGDDALPEPDACLLTGITPQHAHEYGKPEPAFAAAIEAALATPGTIGVGYNSLRFDDEVTRHLFWRNLIDPYAREWRNDCGRWDLLDVVRCARAFHPERLVWPTHADGRASFRLEDLTAANGIAHADAHDALADVRATLALARLIRAELPRLWDFCLRLHRKEAVLEQIGAGNAPLLHVSGRFPAERGCIAVVWPLAPHPSNRNELLVWDLLAGDPQELFTLDAAAIRARLFVRADELPEGVTRLPIKGIHLNKSPVVVAQLRTLRPEVAERWGIDVALALQRAAAMCDAPPLPRELWAAVYARDAAGEVDAEQDLYGAFVSDDDRRRLERLRTLPAADWAARAPRLDDARLEELVFRYRARHHAGTLDADERERWAAHRRAVLHEGRGGGLTLAAYAERIDALAETPGGSDERGEAILAALYEWGERIAPEA